MTLHKGKVAREAIFKKNRNNNWPMKWYVPLACPRTWRHSSTQPWKWLHGVLGQQNFHWDLRSLCHADFILACHTTFLISINNFFSFLILYLLLSFFIWLNFFYFSKLFFPIRGPIHDLVRDPISDPFKACFLTFKLIYGKILGR